MHLVTGEVMGVSRPEVGASCSLTPPKKLLRFRFVDSDLLNVVAISFLSPCCIEAFSDLGVVLIVKKDSVLPRCAFLGYCKYTNGVG